MPKIKATKSVGARALSAAHYVLFGAMAVAAVWAIFR